MTERSPQAFVCPHCGARYKVVRVEAEPERDRAIACRSCGGPLNGRDGPFILKYFLVERPRAHKQRLANPPLFVL